MCSGAATTIRKTASASARWTSAATGYEGAVATLTQELMGLLAPQARRALLQRPLQGPMIFEQTIASQIGYFAAMLYNPNNVSGEVSPGHHAPRGRGSCPARAHGRVRAGSRRGGISRRAARSPTSRRSGSRRNIHYLPVAIAGCRRRAGRRARSGVPEGRHGRPSPSSPLWELLNADTGAALDLWQALWAAAAPDDVRRAVERHSLSAVGLPRITACGSPRTTGDPAPRRRRPRGRDGALLSGKGSSGHSASGLLT